MLLFVIVLETMNEPMDVLISLVITLNFIINGVLVAGCLFKNEKGTVKLALGFAFGIGLMMWLPALTSFIFGFTVISQIIAMAAALLLGTISVLKTGMFSNSTITMKTILAAASGERYLLFTVIPLFAVTLYLLNTHILLMNGNGSMMSGQSTFGDMAMHMSIITSISVQKKFPPDYNLIAGNVRLGYPFLCNSISSTLYTVGVRIRTAYITPMIFAVLSLYISLFVFFEEWLEDKLKSACAVVLFLIGGGFGFAYFFDIVKKYPENFSRIFSGFYTTPTNYVDANVKWVNVIADLLIPQRATLFGWTLLVPALYLLYKTAFNDALTPVTRKKYFIVLGVMAGALPLVHTHSFLALAILSAVYLLYSTVEKKPYILDWFIYAGIALALSSWQLFMFTFQQASGEQFLRRHFNWANSMDNYFWFYIKNIGLPYILILPALLNTGKKTRWFYAGGLAIVLLAELFVFQPNEYDNNKLLYVWHMLTCGIVAGYLVDIFRKMKRNAVKEFAYYACMTAVICNMSGVLTLGREAVSSYDIFDRAHIEAAEYIKRTTTPDSLFLTASNHNNTVASLTGRNILCGSSSYLFFHGLNYRGYELLQEELYKRPTLEKLESSGVDYVFISNYEAGQYDDIDVEFYRSNFVEVFQNSSVVIYAVSDRAIGKDG